MPKNSFVDCLSPDKKKKEAKKAEEAQRRHEARKASISSPIDDQPLREQLVGLKTPRTPPPRPSPPLVTVLNPPPLEQHWRTTISPPIDASRPRLGQRSVTAPLERTNPADIYDTTAEDSLPSDLDPEILAYYQGKALPGRPRGKRDKGKQPAYAPQLAESSRTAAPSSRSRRTVEEIYAASQAEQQAKAEEAIRNYFISEEQPQTPRVACPPTEVPERPREPSPDPDRQPQLYAPSLSSASMPDLIRSQLRTQTPPDPRDIVKEHFDQRGGRAALSVVSDFTESERPSSEITYIDPTPVSPIELEPQVMRFPPRSPSEERRRAEARRAEDEEARLFIERLEAGRQEAVRLRRRGSGQTVFEEPELNEREEPEHLRLPEEHRGRHERDHPNRYHGVRIEYPKIPPLTSNASKKKRM